MIVSDSQNTIHNYIKILYGHIRRLDYDILSAQ